MISIILPTKNEAAYLPVLLDSIARQGINRGNLEVIVADDYSLDGTRKIARDYGCTIVNGGFPAVGRNNGAKHAKGDILMFKDVDSALPHPNFLNLALQEFNDRKLDVAGTLNYALHQKNGFTGLRYKAYIEFFHNGSLILTENTPFPAMMDCMFARKEVHEAIGGFDETLEFGEDCEYAKRAKRVGYNFGILKTPGKVGFNMRRFEEKELVTLLKNVYFNVGRRLLGHEFRRDSTKIKYWKD